MMNESENIDRQGQDFQEECLQYECEQALLRGHFQEPSPEAEWTRFHTRLNTKKTGDRSSAYWTLGGCRHCYGSSRSTCRSTAVELDRGRKRRYPGAVYGYRGGISSHYRGTIQQIRSGENHLDCPGQK